MLASNAFPRLQSPSASRGRLAVNRANIRRAYPSGQVFVVARTFQGGTAFEDVEALWCKVNWQKTNRMEAATLKEACFRAAYDAPFHGVPTSPYMGGRYADMNVHIEKRHRDFLGRSRAALCGHEVSPEEFADAISRLSSILGVSLDRAVMCIFGEPTLLAADNGDIINRLVELRRGNEGKDLADLVVESRGKLLHNAAGVICEDDERDDYS